MRREVLAGAIAGAPPRGTGKPISPAAAGIGRFQSAAFDRAPERRLRMRREDNIRIDRDRFAPGDAGLIEIATARCAKPGFTAAQAAEQDFTSPGS
jgi:hypothetical protein